MTRKTLAIFVLALAVAGAASSAGAARKAAPKVTYAVKGTFSKYTAASDTADGSITIHVASANYHGGALKGRLVTFAITAMTLTTLNGNPTISSGAHGEIKFLARRRMTNAALMKALRPDRTKARQIIVQGRFLPSS
jgi:hypothetical protein